MATFKKKILSPGRYLVSTPSGQRVFKEFSADYLSTVVDNSNKMLESGLYIPVPFQHLKDAVPVTEKVEEDSSKNAGYWNKFWMEDGDLYGEIDAAGDTENHSSNAGKIKHSIKEVSACIKDKYVDGLGREWGPSILHGAAVLHAVVPGQEGFELMEDTVALSISGLDQNNLAGDIAELSRELEELGLYLPAHTSAEELVKVLTIAVRQRNLAAKEEDDEEVVQTRSVFMSIQEGVEMSFTQKEAEEIVRLGLLDPSTKEPVKLGDLKIAEDPRDTFNMSVTTMLKETQKDSIKGRIEALIKTKRISQEFAEKRFYPELETYNLSFSDDGKSLKASALEMTLENLEALPSPGTLDDQSNLSVTDEIHTPEDRSKETLTGEQMDAMSKSLLASI